MIDNLYFDIGSRFGINSPKLLITSAKAGNFRDDEFARNRILTNLGISNCRFALARQEHTKTVIDEREFDSIKGPFDGIISGGRPVAVTAADCMPIFIIALNQKTGCVLHSGWKGTGILKNALDILISNCGIKAEDLIVVFGPHIRSCCYRVDEKRALLFAREWGEDSVERRGSIPYLNMASANKKIAQAAGVRGIFDNGDCSCCDSRYGSFRRQGQGFTKMGAILGFF